MRRRITVEAAPHVFGHARMMALKHGVTEPEAIGMMLARAIVA